MQKQKICIIGGGLTGLVTAIALSKLNYNIDLILGNLGHNLNSNGTIAISQNNFDFLNKLKIFKSRQKVAWPCSKIKLYEQAKSSNFSDIFEFQYNYKKKAFYMLENSIITKMMMKGNQEMMGMMMSENEDMTAMMKDNPEMMHGMMSNMMNMAEADSSMCAHMMTMMKDKPNMMGQMMEMMHKEGIMDKETMMRNKEKMGKENHPGHH